MKEVIIYNRPLIKPSNKLRDLEIENACLRDTTTCLASGILKLGFSIFWNDLKNNVTIKRDNAKYYVINVNSSRLNEIIKFHDNLDQIGLFIDSGSFRQNHLNHYRTIYKHRPFWVSNTDKGHIRLDSFMLENKREPSEYILIAAPGIPHYPYKSTFEWVKEKLRLINHYSFPVKVRLHPLDTSKNDYQWKEINDKIDREEKPEKSLAKALVLITSASSIALEAFIRGVPVIADNHAPYYLVAYKNLEEALNHQNNKSQIKFLERFVYTQFSPKELCTGEGFLELLK